jgi:hypothetical protein
VLTRFVHAAEDVPQILRVGLVRADPRFEVPSSTTDDSSLLEKQCNLSQRPLGARCIVACERWPSAGAGGASPATAPLLG